MKDYFKFWGKTDDKGNWHPLVCHMLDVAAVALEVLKREPVSTKSLFSDDFHSDWENTKGFVGFFVALHDLGKASPSFQMMVDDKVPDVASRLHSIGLIWNDRIEYQKHGKIGQRLFECEVAKYLNCDYDTIKYISEAVNAHHGFNEVIRNETMLSESGLKRSQNRWKEVRSELIADLKDFFIPTQAMNFSSFSGAAYMRLAGLTSFADWIGSNEEFYPYFCSASFTLQEYWLNAVEQAQNALNSIGWIHKKSKYIQPPPFEELFAPYAPRPLQLAMIQACSEIDGPALLIIEAPTGEGKTEAAFYSHIALQSKNNHRGMYIALPSRATGNAMFTRTLEFLNSTHPDTELDLQLLHGATLLNDSYQKLRLASVFGANYKRDQTDDSISAHEWFTHKKRGMLSEYGVGTVDQALMSVLNIKHNFVRLWGLGNRTVVIDEVHAYDVYTSTILDRLLEWLKKLGSSVILMSATLPRKRRTELLKAWGSDNVSTCDYPRVIICDKRDTVKTYHFDADAKRKRLVTIKSAPTDIEELTRFSIALIKNGGCLAVIVNTVQRAQDLYKHLINLNDKETVLLLFHARFPAGLRQEKEDKILSLFGKTNIEKRPQKAILVATQVVEQSLDLDFDVMISDLAPIDLLLQRVGRVHRHDRDSSYRYDHQKPLLYVSGMGGDDLPYLNEPLYWGSVYEPYVLYRTWITLGGEYCVNIPDDTDGLIESVYGEEDELV